MVEPEECELKFITQVLETIENNWDGSTYDVVERYIIDIARQSLVESGGVTFVESESKDGSI